MAGEQKSDLLKFKSSRFGDLEVAASSVMELIGGVIGFPNFNRYVVLDYNPPFSWLHSVESPELAFVIVNGAEFGTDYSFPLPIGDRDLDLRQEDDIAIINLVSVRPTIAETTVNLKAPIIVNLKNLRGRQIILDDPRFPTRFPLWTTKEGQNTPSE